jgi:hypothetical protein
MKYIGVTDDGKKVILLRSWGGEDLVKFMKTHAKIVFEAIPATDDTAAIPEDTYAQVITKVKDELRLLVNRTMAMHQLLTTKQGDRTWMDFIKDLEDKAHILAFDTQAYKQNDAVKDAAIFGMADPRLKEKALAEDPDLETLIRWGQSREAGREGAHSLKGTESSTIAKIEEKDLDVKDIEEMMDSLQIMKLKKQGRYRARPKTSRSPLQNSAARTAQANSGRISHARPKEKHVLHATSSITSRAPKSARKQRHERST